MATTRYIWHHQLHETWAGERLYFWRLAFFPTYEPKAIRPALQKVLDQHGVSSYALYEIYGVYDLVLRIWLPTRVTPEEFENSLTHSLSAFHLELCDVFSVGKILRHWPWRRESSGMLTLDPKSFDTRLPQHDLSKINAVARGNEPVTKYEAVRDAADKGYIAPCPTDQRHIKFLVVVTSSSQLATIAARDELRHQLISIVDDAEGQGGISDTSLYEGSGFGQFILLGRIDPNQFSDLRAAIIDRVNAAGTGHFFRARPYTYITAMGPGGDGLAPQFVDEIPAALDSAKEREPIEAFLARDEAENLEMKASAFVSVDRWLHSGKAVREENITNDGVLKAVVGMLNRQGGTVIVGVLEKERYDDGTLKKRQAEPFPVVGNYICVGIELDYQGKDWDHYALRLQSIIMERIDPPPVGLVNISKIDVEGKSLCIISVQRTSREWFYLTREKGAAAEFFVRLGNSTRDLRGPVADGYKQSYPRG